MKRLVFAFLVACGGTAKPVVEPPKQPPVVTTPTETSKELTGVVAKLRVEGATAGQRTEIEAALGIAMGKPLGGDELRGALVNVMRITGIADAVIKGVQLAEGIELLVEVTQHPVMKKLVALEGGKSISLGIGAPTTGGPLEPQRVQELAQTLRDRYVTNGYFDADATWKQTPVAGGVEVTIELVPGPISAIDAITFTGATLPAKDLVGVVAKWLVVGQPVVEARIDSAAQALSAYYWEKGYANVHVVSPEIKAGRIPLAFKITEGPVFKIGVIDIKGVPAADHAKYLKLFGVKQGDTFSRNAIASGRDKILLSLNEAGKKLANVLPLTKVDMAGKRISLTLEITGAD